MINDDGCLITSDWGHDMSDVVAKLDIATQNPRAKLIWEMFRKNPTLFEFAVGYKEDAEGNKELMEISIITRGKREQDSTRKSTL